MEGGALQEQAFVDFAKDYVLFCHITSRVPGEKYDQLLQEKGGSGFPYFAFLDADGNLVARHDGMRSADGFAKTAEKVAAFRELKGRAEKGDKTALVDFFFARLDLGHLSLEQAKAERTKLTLTEEQTAKADAALLNLEVDQIMKSITDEEETHVDIGLKFVAMEKEGRIPTGESQFMAFWSLILRYGELKKDIPAFEKALTAMKEKYEKDPRAQKFFQQKEKQLEEMKKESGKEQEAPPREEGK